MSELLDSFLDENPVLLEQPSNEIWIAIRMDAPPPVPLGMVPQALIGDGSQADPFCGNTPEQLDYVLFHKALPNSMPVSFGRTDTCITTAGTLVRAYDFNALKYLYELEDAVEDVMIPL